MDIQDLTHHHDNTIRLITLLTRKEDPIRLQTPKSSFCNIFTNTRQKQLEKIVIEQIQDSLEILDKHNIDLPEHSIALYNDFIYNDFIAKLKEDVVPEHDMELHDKYTSFEEILQTLQSYIYIKMNEDVDVYITEYYLDELGIKSSLISTEDEIVGGVITTTKIFHIIEHDRYIKFTKYTQLDKDYPFHAEAEEYKF